MRTLRTIGAALGCGFGMVLGGCASPPDGPPPIPVQYSAGAWSFDYDAITSVASAMLRSSQGALLVEVSCQGPNGPIIVRDWTFTDMLPGPHPATVMIGTAIVPVDAASPASPAGRGGLTFALDPRGAAVSESFAGQTVRVTSAAVGHVWADGAAAEIAAVANACVQRGS